MTSSSRAAGGSTGINWILLAAVNGFLAVAAGAFGAHGLKEVLTADRLDVFEVAARYQMYHALAILLTASLSMRMPAASLNWACILFQLGIVLFSGSLYALSITGVSELGIITPFGGLALLGGWAALAIAAYRTARPS